MKTFIQELAYLSLSFIALSSSAFAVDQVTLSNGQVLEGKVLNDVPNRYVDIELLNGNKQRIQKTNVASVERDVPSSKDSSMSGVDSTIYFGVLGGLSIYSESGSPSYSQFAYGARFGVNATQLGDFGKLAFGLSFDRYTLAGSSIPSYVSASVTTIAAQLLVRKIANSGFYFGPEAGLAIMTSSGTFNGFSASESNNAFNIGAVIGYDFYLNQNFSVGPEIHYDHISSFTDSTGGQNPSASAYKFFLNLTYSL